MRIGLLLAESRGGIGQHVASLVPRFVSAGHEVVVCAPPGTAEHFDFAPATVVVPGGRTAWMRRRSTRTATAPA